MEGTTQSEVVFRESAEARPHPVRIRGCLVRKHEISLVLLGLPLLRVYACLPCCLVSAFYLLKS